MNIAEKICTKYKLHSHPNCVEMEGVFFQAIGTEINQITFSYVLFQKKNR